jgi:hypothetical protein
MQHSDVVELAKGLVPYVREVVADTAIDVVAENLLVSPELALQLKAAADLLAEPMPVQAVYVPPEIPRRVTGAVITRSGELSISYSDGLSERLGLVIGPPGEKGAQGEAGRDGIGAKGDDGAPGRDGVGIVAAAINRAGELLLTMSDGSVLTPGRVTAAKKT